MRPRVIVGVVGAAGLLAVTATSGLAAGVQPIAPTTNSIAHAAQDIYIDGYHRHRHHHGHVHGNPHRRHLDCRWYGNHEHCQVHVPRPRHWGHVHGNPYRPHLDCRWHGNHEHCRPHYPRRHYYDY